MRVEIALFDGRTTVRIHDEIEEPNPQFGRTLAEAAKRELFMAAANEALRVLGLDKIREQAKRAPEVPAPVSEWRPIKPEDVKSGDRIRFTHTLHGVHTARTLTVGIIRALGSNGIEFTSAEAPAYAELAIFKDDLAVRRNGQALEILMTSEEDRG